MCTQHVYPKHVDSISLSTIQSFKIHPPLRSVSNNTEKNIFFKCLTRKKGSSNSPMLAGQKY